MIIINSINNRFKLMKQLLKNIYISNFDLSLVRAVYFNEKIFEDFTDNFKDYCYPHRYIEIAAL